MRYEVGSRRNSQVGGRTYEVGSKNIGGVKYELL